MKIWKVILAALVIFGAGVITGGLTVRLKFLHRPARAAEGSSLPIWMQQRGEMLAQMERRLDLTPRQRTQVTHHLRESQQRMRELWDPVAPQAREESRLLRERILAELTPEQARRFDQAIRPSRGFPRNGERPRESVGRREESRREDPLRRGPRPEDRTRPEPRSGPDSSPRPDENRRPDDRPRSPDRPQ